MKKYEGAQAAHRDADQDRQKGFHWIDSVVDALGKYEADRTSYPTLDAFMPEIARTLDEFAPKFDKVMVWRKKNAPKIVSMVPKNESKGVDPATTAVVVTFDRPMQDGSWAFMCPGQDCLKAAGSLSYDKSKRILTIPVKLEPNRVYRFGLNAPGYEGFRSVNGAPLEPVDVVFTTGSAR